MRLLTTSCIVLTLTVAACGANATSDPRSASLTSSPVPATPAAVSSENARSAPAPAVAASSDAGRGDVTGASSTVPAAAAVLDPASAAPAPSEYREVTLPAGTRMSVAMRTAVSSRTSEVEQGISGTLRNALVVRGLTVVPAGAALAGYVTEARRSGRVKGRARVGFRFTSLRVDGESHPVRTAPIAREARGTKKQDAVKIGVGTGAGALVGAIAGGKKGAAIGTAVGAAGGTGVVLATRGEEVTVPAGSVVTTRLTAPLTIRVRMP